MLQGLWHNFFVLQTAFWFPPTEAPHSKWNCSDKVPIENANHYLLPLKQTNKQTSKQLKFHLKMQTTICFLSNKQTNKQTDKVPIENANLYLLPLPASVRPRNCAPWQSLFSTVVLFSPICSWFRDASQKVRQQLNRGTKVPKNSLYGNTIFSFQEYI